MLIVDQAIVVYTCSSGQAEHQLCVEHGRAGVDALYSRPGGLAHHRPAQEGDGSHGPRSGSQVNMVHISLIRTSQTKGSDSKGNHDRRHTKSSFFICDMVCMRLDCRMIMVIVLFLYLNGNLFIFVSMGSVRTDSSGR